MSDPPAPEVPPACASFRASIGRSCLRPALLALLLCTGLTGVVYPLLVLALARLAWPRQAEGSLVRRGGQRVGSRWIGQEFRDPGHFWGRPSAAADAAGRPAPCNGAASGGSSLAPEDPAFARQVLARAAALRAADPGQAGPVPADLVTASGSGLDPHISPAAAAWQAHRVALRRGLDEARVRRLLADHTEGPQAGLLGEPRVNVLELNLALDALDARAER
jgi:K+-transporting ATPase ATPase C chain